MCNPKLFFKEIYTVGQHDIGKISLWEANKQEGNAFVAKLIKIFTLGCFSKTTKIILQKGMLESGWINGSGHENNLTGAGQGH